VLIQKQPEHARWGGLWTFPFAGDKQSLVQRFKLKPQNLRPRLTLRHGFTRYQIRLEVYETIPSRRETVPSTVCKKMCQWIHISKLSDYPFPSPHQKIANVLSEENASPSF
jgi:adenine-specific DNA glycosylase